MRLIVALEPWGKRDGVRPAARQRVPHGQVRLRRLDRFPQRYHAIHNRVVGQAVDREGR